ASPRVSRRCRRGRARPAPWRSVPLPATAGLRRGTWPLSGLYSCFSRSKERLLLPVGVEAGARSGHGMQGRDRFAHQNRRHLRQLERAAARAGLAELEISQRRRNSLGARAHVAAREADAYDHASAVEALDVVHVATTVDHLAGLVA